MTGFGRDLLVYPGLIIRWFILLIFSLIKRKKIRHIKDLYSSRNEYDIYIAVVGESTVNGIIGFAFWTALVLIGTNEYKISLFIESLW